MSESLVFLVVALVLILIAVGLMFITYRKGYTDAIDAVNRELAREHERMFAKHQEEIQKSIASLPPQNPNTYRGDRGG